MDNALVADTTEALLRAEPRPAFIQRILDQMGKYMIVEGGADERWTFVVGYITSHQDTDSMASFLRGTRRNILKWNPLGSDLALLDDVIIRWETLTAQGAVVS